MVMDTVPPVPRLTPLRLYAYPNSWPMNLYVLSAKRIARRKPSSMVTFETLPAESTFVPRLVLPKRDTPPLNDNSPTCAEAKPAPVKRNTTAAQRRTLVLLISKESGYFELVTAGRRAKVYELAIDRHFHGRRG